MCGGFMMMEVRSMWITNMVIFLAHKTLRIMLVYLFIYLHKTLKYAARVARTGNLRKSYNCLLQDRSPIKCIA